jgi:hypothetical protein
MHLMSKALKKLEMGFEIFEKKKGPRAFPNMRTKGQYTCPSCSKQNIVLADSHIRRQ